MQKGDRALTERQVPFGLFPQGTDSGAPLRSIPIMLAAWLFAVTIYLKKEFQFFTVALVVGPVSRFCIFY